MNERQALELHTKGLAGFKIPFFEHLPPIASDLAILIPLTDEGKVVAWLLSTDWVSLSVGDLSKQSPTLWSLGRCDSAELWRCAVPTLFFQHTPRHHIVGRGATIRASRRCLHPP
jgi:hypothetical protein